MTQLQYRADIDGLRAVAVLAVVLFHFRIPGTEGGYVGVDVFFVISGYLMTSIIQGQIRAGSFSMVRFYERRVRRLLPALFVVVAFTFAVGWFVLFPGLLKELGQSMVAVSVFASNILFWLESGYFDDPAELKPLLHTWSLAVEEQFYVFLPPFLVLLHRISRRAVVGITTACFIASFAASAALIDTLPTTVFYHFPFRAWELLLGALLAFKVLPPLSTARGASASGIVGLILIIAPVVLYTERTVFPGFAAVPPCLGTALVIHAGLTPGTLGGRLLALPPFVFVGKISYSLYLWHWPVVVFARYLQMGAEPGPATTATIIVLVFVVSALSWRYVEMPFRSAAFAGSLSRSRVFASAAALSLVWIAIGISLHRTRGAPWRIPEQARRFATAWEDTYAPPQDCRRWSGAEGQARGFCLLGAPEAETPSAFIWGDSHADALLEGLQIAAQDEGVAMLHSSIEGCPPLLGVEQDEHGLDDYYDLRCHQANRQIESVLLAAREVRRVILVGRWAYVANGGGVGTDSKERFDIWKANTPRGSQSNAEVFSEALVATIRRLRAMGKSVVVIRQVPEVEGFSAQSLAIAWFLDAEAAQASLRAVQTIARASVAERQKHFEHSLSALRGLDGLTVVDLWSHFCDEQECRAVDDDGQPLFTDDNHVTRTTARALAPLLRGAFTGIAPSLEP